MKIMNIVFLCGARDFHAIDWYKSANKSSKYEVSILTDLIEAEGFVRLINKDDKVHRLLIIDRYLFTTQSNLGNIWRNFVKILVFPIQVYLLRRFSRKFPSTVFHAHSMYYLFLGYVAGVKYVGSPQGSDILIKPYRSKIYRYFTIKSLKAALFVIVDSISMQDKTIELSGIKPYIIQNGIDISAIKELRLKLSDNIKRNQVVSLRGFTELYRIDEILKSRNSSKVKSDIPIIFIYPFYEHKYMDETSSLILDTDKILGRLNRESLYQQLFNSYLVISIPKSDSSPRSVYEAIFCGCVVAITYNPYYDTLPDCMKSRIILVDILDSDWLVKANKKALEISAIEYYPSSEALMEFDQLQSYLKIEKIIDNLN